MDVQRAICAALLLFLPAVEGLQLIKPWKTTYNHAATHFGPPVSTRGSSKALTVASPLNGCSPLDQSTISYKNTVVLVSSSGCFVSEKVRHSYNADASAVVVVMSSSLSELRVATAEDAGAFIPSVVVSAEDGADLQRIVAEHKPGETLVSLSTAGQVNSLWRAARNPWATAFMVAGVCGGLLCILVTARRRAWCRPHNPHRAMAAWGGDGDDGPADFTHSPALGPNGTPPREGGGGRRRTREQIVEKLPTATLFDPQCTRQRMFSNACIICIEEFGQGDILRLLPCKHLFHQECIDPWLLERDQRCPVCKRDFMLPSSRVPTPRGNHTRCGSAGSDEDIDLPPLQLPQPLIRARSRSRGSDDGSDATAAVAATATAAAAAAAGGSAANSYSTAAGTPGGGGGGGGGGGDGGGGGGGGGGTLQHAAAAAAALAAFAAAGGSEGYDSGTGESKAEGGTTDGAGHRHPHHHTQLRRWHSGDKQQQGQRQHHQQWGRVRSGSEGSHDESNGRSASSHPYPLQQQQPWLQAHRSLSFDSNSSGGGVTSDATDSSGSESEGESWRVRGGGARTRGNLTGSRGSRRGRGRGSGSGSGSGSSGACRHSRSPSPLSRSRSPLVPATDSSHRRHRSPQHASPLSLSPLSRSPLAHSPVSRSPLARSPRGHSPLRIVSASPPAASDATSHFFPSNFRSATAANVAAVAAAAAAAAAVPPTAGHQTYSLGRSIFTRSPSPSPTHATSSAAAATAAISSAAADASAAAAAAGSPDMAFTPLTAADLLQIQRQPRAVPRRGSHGESDAAETAAGTADAWGSSFSGGEGDWAQQQPQQAPPLHFFPTRLSIASATAPATTDAAAAAAAEFAASAAGSPPGSSGYGDGTAATAASLGTTGSPLQLYSAAAASPPPSPPCEQSVKGLRLDTSGAERENMPPPLLALRLAPAVSGGADDASAASPATSTPRFPLLASRELTASTSASALQRPARTRLLRHSLSSGSGSGSVNGSGSGSGSGNGNSNGNSNGSEYGSTSPHGSTGYDSDGGVSGTRRLRRRMRLRPRPRRTEWDDGAIEAAQSLPGFLITPRPQPQSQPQSQSRQSPSQSQSLWPRSPLQPAVSSPQQPSGSPQLRSLSHLALPLSPGRPQPQPQPDVSALRLHSRASLVSPRRQAGVRLPLTPETPARVGTGSFPATTSNRRTSGGDGEGLSSGGEGSSCVVTPSAISSSLGVGGGVGSSGNGNGGPALFPWGAEEGDRDAVRASAPADAAAPTRGSASHFHFPFRFQLPSFFRQSRPQPQQQQQPQPQPQPHQWQHQPSDDSGSDGEGQEERKRSAASGDDGGGGDSDLEMALPVAHASAGSPQPGQRGVRSSSAGRSWWRGARHHGARGRGAAVVDGGSTSGAAAAASITEDEGLGAAKQGAV